MSNNKPRSDRRSVRMKHYDYSQSGFYLVTICVEKHRCTFGDIRDDTMHRNGAGQIAQSIWESLPQRFSTVQLDTFMIMPNHMHGIIELVAIEISPDVARSISHTPTRFQAHMRDEAIKKANPSLGQIVRTFKGAATYEIHRADRPDFAWQVGYHESVLRNEKALDYARNYIVNNPVTWLKDSLRA